AAEEGGGVSREEVSDAHTPDALGELASADPAHVALAVGAALFERGRLAEAAAAFGLAAGLDPSDAVAPRLQGAALLAHGLLARCRARYRALVPPGAAAPFVPTPQTVVDRMLELAKVTKDDVVYDLGCGDGRIVVTAARRYGCRAWGFDVDPDRVKESL